MSAFAEFERAGWSEPGKADRYEAFAAPLTEHAIEPVLDAAGVHAGTRILDVACGTGALCAAAEAREADPFGVDVSPEMIRFARENRPHLPFDVADAAALPFDDDSFDVAIAAFLLHHVPDPQAVVRELGRVARSVALATWDAAERMRVFGVFVDTFAVLGIEAVGPRGPSREELARDDVLEGLLSEAGLREIRIQQLSFEHQIDGVDELWDGFLAASVNTAATVQGQSEEMQARIREELAGRLAEYERDGAFVLPVSVKIAAGR